MKNEPASKRARPLAARPWAVRDILGVEVCSLSAAAIVELIDRLVADGPATVVAFLNANLSNHAWNNQELTGILNRSLVLNDGLGVDIASWVLHGDGFADNLNGTDFIPFYLRSSSRRLRIFLLGGTAESADAALFIFRRNFPRHEFVGAHHGYFTEEAREGLLLSIKHLMPDVILLALGNPKQELFAGNYLPDLGCRLLFCVGGLVDFTSGAARRAPAWIRKFRMEWFYRLWREPGRMWRRYVLGNPLFLLRVAMAKLASLGNRP